MREEYQIGSHLNLAHSLARAEKLAERAKKKGLIGGYAVTTEKRLVDEQLQDFLIIEGEPARHRGWSFVAVADWLGELPVLSGSPYYVGAPVDRASLKRGWCEHCKTTRRRLKCIIVENESGDRVQVGTSCVKDFLGQELTPAFYSTDSAFEELGGMRGAGIDTYELFSVIAFSVMLTEKFGYQNRDSENPTSEDVRLLLRGARGRVEQERLEKIRPQLDLTAAIVSSRQAAVAFYEWVAELADSEWSMNAKAAILNAEDFGNRFPVRQLGLIVSAAGSYAKSLQQKVEKEESVIVNEVYAEAGVKVDVDVEIEKVHGFEGAYGFTYIYTFIGDGHRFKWFTAKDLMPDVETFSAMAGARFHLRGSVKGADEYRGEVSTLVTRCKALPLG